MQAANPAYSEAEEVVQLTAAAEDFNTVVNNETFDQTSPTSEEAGRPSCVCLNGPAASW